MAGIRCGLAALLSGVCLMAAGAVAAAELVITQSTIVGLDPGTVIDGGQPIKIRKGHRLTLISPTGKVIALVGPYEGVPDGSVRPGDGKLVTALSALVAGHGRDESQLGAIRDAATARGKDPYAIDVSGTGPQCAVQGRPLRLWQPRGAPIDSLWIARDGTGEAAVVAWPAGEATVDWPGSLRPTDGARYKLLQQPSREESVLDLHLIAAVDGNLAVLAVAMAEKGCAAQATALIATPEK